MQRNRKPRSALTRDYDAIDQLGQLNIHEIAEVAHLHLSTYPHPALPVALCGLVTGGIFRDNA